MDLQQSIKYIFIPLNVVNEERKLLLAETAASMFQLTFKEPLAIQQKSDSNQSCLHRLFVIHESMASVLSHRSVSAFLNPESADKHLNNFVVCTDYGHFTLDTGIVQFAEEVDESNKRGGYVVSTGEKTWALPS